MKTKAALQAGSKAAAESTATRTGSGCKVCATERLRWLAIHVVPRPSTHTTERLSTKLKINQLQVQAWQHNLTPRSAPMNRTQEPIAIASNLNQYIKVTQRETATDLHAALGADELNPGAHCDILQLEQPMLLRLECRARRNLPYQVRRQHVACATLLQSLEKSSGPEGCRNERRNLPHQVRRQHVACTGVECLRNLNRAAAIYVRACRERTADSTQPAEGLRVLRAIKMYSSTAVSA